MKHPLKLISIRKPVHNPHTGDGFCHYGEHEAQFLAYYQVMGKMPPIPYSPESIAGQQWNYSNMKRKQLSIEELTR